MNRLLCGLLLLLAASAAAQQVHSSPYSPPPYNAPPALEQNPVAQMPPDTAAPPPQQLSSTEVQQQIQQKLDSEPALANAPVKAVTDDSSVVLTGTVEDERQHDLALRIAESYSGNRQVVDQITLRPRS